jgi:excisionase family DNA binding protein
VATTVTLTKLMFKPEEAAALLSRGRTKIFAALKSGELRSVKAGGSRLIPADAILEYAEQLAAGEASDRPRDDRAELAPRRAPRHRAPFWRVRRRPLVARALRSPRRGGDPVRPGVRPEGRHEVGAA